MMAAPHGATYGLSLWHDGRRGLAGAQAMCPAGGLQAG